MKLNDLRKAVEIQTIVFAKDASPSDVNDGSGWTAAAARDWLKAHDFKTGNHDETAGSHRFRQFDPGRCEAESYRSLTEGFPAGVTAVSCQTGAAAGEGERRNVSGVQRAWATFQVKDVNEETRTIEGVATTPSTDRVGDIVEPQGAKFKLPLPLLFQHNHDEPIGDIVEAKVTRNGIMIKAQVAKIPEPGALRDRIEAAWQSIKYKLVRGLSIGYIPLDYEPIDEKDPWGGLRIKEWDWIELSAVTVPANMEATIQTVKQLDESSRRAASGAPKPASRVVKLDPPKPGVSGRQRSSTQILSTEKSTMRTIAERIAAYEAKRQANVARMQSIMDGADDEGRSLNEDEDREYTELSAEVATVDKEIKRLRDHEALVASSATQVRREVGTDPERSSEARGSIVSVSRNLPKGIAFARMAMALANAKGNLYEAAHDAEQRWKDTPEVGQILRNYKQISEALAQAKTAVAVGDTTTSGWASQLVVAQNMVAEFVELLRPATIIGRLTGFRNVPFNVQMPRETAGSSVGWVGQNKPAKVSKLTLDSISLGMAKINGIIVLTQELVRSSSPAAEMLCRDDMVAAVAQFMDEQFIDPDVAAVANVSPASVLNGVTDVASTGATIAAIDEDCRQVMQAMITANIPLNGCAWVMNPRSALSLSLIRTTQDVLAYPGITATGGTFKGLPVVTSNSVKIASDTHSTTNLALVSPGNVLMADDGSVTIDVSTEASVELDDSPTTGAATLISLWQRGLVGLRAGRYINWLKRRAAAAQYISGVQY